MTEPNTTQDTPATAAVPKVPAKRRSGGAVWVLLFILLIVGMGAASYLWLWPQWQQRESVLAQLQQDVVALRGQQAALEQGLMTSVEQRLSAWSTNSDSTQQNALAEVNAQSEQLRAEMSQLTAQVGRLDQQLGRLTATDRRLWLTQEAAFLVRLASQRLLAFKDIEAAMALLANADALLQEAADPRLDAARQALAADRLALRLAPRADSVGLNATLAALMEQVSALQLSHEIEPARASAAHEPNGASSALVSGWRAALAKLSDYLVITRRDHAPQLLSPDLLALQRGHLMLLLQQAQVAALSANQALFDQSIARLRRLIEQLAKANIVGLNGLMPVIDELSATVVEQAIPDVLTTRAALDDALRMMRAESEADLTPPAASP